MKLHNQTESEGAHHATTCTAQVVGSLFGRARVRECDGAELVETCRVAVVAFVLVGEVRCSLGFQGFVQVVKAGGEISQSFLGGSEIVAENFRELAKIHIVGELTSADKARGAATLQSAQERYAASAPEVQDGMIKEWVNILHLTK